MVTEEEIIEHVKSLSYQDKIKLINKITPLKDFNNQKYRDKIMREMFDIPETKGYYGPDSETKSLKSVSITPTKNKTYNITKGKTLGILGRIDKVSTHDNSDTIFGLFSEEGEIKFVILVHSDENLDNLFKMERGLKQKKMENAKNKYDGVTINFKVILKYNLSYEILYKSDDVILKIL
jgi:hypothetical protein